MPKIKKRDLPLGKEFMTITDDPSKKKKKKRGDSLFKESAGKTRFLKKKKPVKGILEQQGY
tara:strand:+ start:978 stop:1160 length:183 start_codon:yes stop_codon:yes gene_type:complete